MSNSLTFKVFVSVGIGGMIGAILRFSIAAFIVEESVFPFATLVANLIGCLLLSYLIFQPTIKNILSPEIFTGLTTGVIGSFTTFSTFAVETIIAWETSIMISILYVVSNILGGLLFCYFGYRLALSTRRAKT